jgi:hypothetical protein
VYRFVEERFFTKDVAAAYDPGRELASILSYTA